MPRPRIFFYFHAFSLKWFRPYRGNATAFFFKTRRNSYCRKIVDYDSDISFRQKIDSDISTGKRCDKETKKCVTSDISTTLYRPRRWGFKPFTCEMRLRKYKSTLIDKGLYYFISVKLLILETIVSQRPW